MSTGKILGVTGDRIFIASGDSSLAGDISAIPRVSEHVTWSSDSMKWEAGPATVQADTIVANVVRVKELQNENGEKIVVLDEGLMRRLLDHVKDLQKEVETLKLTKSDKRKPRAKPKKTRGVKVTAKKIKELISPYDKGITDGYKGAADMSKAWKDWSSSFGEMKAMDILKRIQEIDVDNMRSMSKSKGAF